jgi:hypothetical protein
LAAYKDFIGGVQLGFGNSHLQTAWGCVLSIIYWGKFHRALGSDVDAVEGLVNLRIKHHYLRPPRSQYVIELEKLRFDTAHRIFLAFKNGDPYRIYYAPGSNTILSAEWLRND